MNTRTSTLVGLALAACCLFVQADDTCDIVFAKEQASYPLVPYADEPELRLDVTPQASTPATYRYTVSFTDRERGTVERRSFTSSHEYNGKSSYCYKGQFFVLTSNDWEDTMALAVIDWSKPEVLEEEWLFDLKAHKVIVKRHEDSFRREAREHQAPVPYIVWHHSQYEVSPQGVGLKLGEDPRGGCTLRWHYDAATGETRIDDSSQPADRQPALERRQRRLAWEDITHAPAPLRGPEKWNMGRYVFEGAGEADMAAFRHALSACATLELTIHSIGHGERPIWTRRVTGKELRAVLDSLAAVPQWYTRRKLQMLRGRIHPADRYPGFRFLDAEGHELPLPRLFCQGEYLPKPLLRYEELKEAPVGPSSFFPYPPREQWEGFMPRYKRPR